MDNNEKINSIIENLRKKYQQEYGVAVFDIDLKETKNGVEIKGEVLVEGQRESLLSALKENRIKVVKENIKILSDASKRYEIDWAIVKSGILDLKLRYVSNKIINEKILKRIRCSQAFKGEILRILYKNEDQLLVQQSDLSLGWVNRKIVVLKRASSSPDKGRLGGVYKEWKKGNFAVRDKVIKITNKRIKKTNCHSEFNSESVVDFKKDILVQKKQKISGQKLGDKIIKEAEKYLGVNYVLGGKSKKGIDCSGLVQVAYKNSFNIILPKHSWDQKEIGKKVDLKDIKTGDLIFLIKKSNKHKHVGIIERASESLPETLTGRKINLIHASLDKKKVLRQDLDEVFGSYNFVEARRIAE